MKRRGFTIVELLMVMGIIAVLLTIVVSTTSGAIKQARKQRATALCTLVSQGIATYYAQKGEWPVEPGEPSGDDSVYVYSASDANTMIRKVVEQTKANNPMIDVAGLFVSWNNGEPGSTDTGLDFMTAVRGTRKNATKMKLTDMHFGYPEAERGRFRRFIIQYSPASDSITVRKWTDEEEKARSISHD